MLTHCPNGGPGDLGPSSSASIAKGATRRLCSTRLRPPDAAAYVRAPLAIASANGGPDSYWHRRTKRDGRPYHVGRGVRAAAGEALVPGALVLYGLSMGGYGALLAGGTGRHRQRREPLPGGTAASPSAVSRAGRHGGLLALGSAVPDALSGPCLLLDLFTLTNFGTRALA